MVEGMGRWGRETVEGVLKRREREGKEWGGGIPLVGCWSVEAAWRAVAVACSSSSVG